MSGVPCIHDTMIKKTPQCLGKTNKFKDSNTHMIKKDKHKQRTTVFGEKDMIKKTNTNKFKNKKRQRNTKN